MDSIVKLLLSFCLITILFISFKDIKKGTALYFAYSILVPFVNLDIGFVMGENYINMFFLIAFWVNAKRKKYKIDYNLFLPFILYYILALFSMPFQGEMEINEMFSLWWKEAVLYLSLPFIIWNVCRNENDSICIYRRAFVISLLIALIYGLIVAILHGINPYQELMGKIGGDDFDWNRYYEAANEGRIFGRISSVFQHPMMFAVYIGLSLIYLVSIRNSLKSKSFLILFILTCFLSLVCGVRSVIAALAAAFAFFLYSNGNKRLLVGTAFISVILLFIISHIPLVYDYIYSMIDFENKKGNVSGSNMELRLVQFQGALMEMSSNPIFGLGFRWNFKYRLLYGDHPIMLGFESLIYVVLCNWGLVGVLVWCIMAYLIIKKNRSLGHPQSNLANSLLVFFVVFNVATGDFGMKLFILFYVLFHSNLSQDKNIERIVRK